MVLNIIDILLIAIFVNLIFLLILLLPALIFILVKIERRKRRLKNQEKFIKDLLKRSNII